MITTKKDGTSVAQGRVAPAVAGARLGARLERFKYLYLLLLPALLYYFVFHYLPMYGIVLAFKHYRFNTPSALGDLPLISYVGQFMNMNWVGLQWFEMLWVRPDFWRAFSNTLLISFYRILFGFPAPNILALLMNEVRHNGVKRVYQTVYTFPHFLSWVLVAGVLFGILSTNGALNQLIVQLGGERTRFLTDNSLFRGLLVSTEIWKSIGWGSIIFLAAIPSEFVHIGGDEADKTHWKRCPKCRARMRREGLASVGELQSYFVRRIEAIFRRHGRRLLGWDEIMDGGLAPSAAVMYWRSEEGEAALSGRIREAAERGHQVVMTPQTCCYLDYHQDANWFNEPSGWIGTVTLRTAYSLEPIPHGLAEEHQANILGAQGNLWCDRIVSFETAGYQLFPRALALAEVAWSPRSQRDYRALTERIVTHLPRLAALQVNARYPDGIDSATGTGC